MMTSLPLSYGIATAALDGEAECGDQYLIKKLSESVLIAVIDGLGHGKEAVYAAKEAVRALNESDSESLIELIHACHHALKKTHGAVLSLFQIQANNNISWLGVGNVTAIHWKKNYYAEKRTTIFLPQGGIVGLNLPLIQVGKFSVELGDTLILATDGIKPEFTSLKPMYPATSQTIANYVFKSYQNPNDDALVLVIQWKNTEVDS